MTERKTLQLRDPSEGADAAPVLKKKGRGWEISEKRLDAIHERARYLRQVAGRLYDRGRLFAALVLLDEVGGALREDADRAVPLRDPRALLRRG